MANGVAVLDRSLGKRLGALPITLTLALTFIVFYGLNHGWKATFGALFNRVGNWTLSIAHVINTQPLHFLLSVNSQIEQWFSDAQRYSERGMIWGINNVVELPLLLAGTALALAMEIFQLGEWTTSQLQKTVPRIVRETIVRPAERVGQRAIARLDGEYHTLTVDLSRLRARVAAIAAGLADAIPHTLPRLGRLERDLSAAEKWLKEHRWLASYAGLLGLGLALLKRLGLGWTRCTNMNRIGKRICGVNPSWVEDFLAATLLVVGTQSFEEFVKEAQAGFDLGLEGLQLFIREFQSLDIPKG